MPLNPQSQALLAAFLAQGFPPFWTLEPAVAREMLAGFSGFIPVGPSLLAVEGITVDGGAGLIDARLYRPGEQCPGLIIYFHGGGWVQGQLADVDAVCRYLALDSGWAVLSVDYRLAPEHPFPAAAEDALAATRWAAAATLDGVQPGRIVVAGDSAGGNLAAVVAAQAHGNGAVSSTLVGQVLVYPVIAADFASESYVEWGEGSLLTADAMRWFWGHYIPDEATRADPLVSPISVRPEGTPVAALVLLAECDPLRSEGEAYAKALADAGGSVLVRHFDGVPHGFFTMPGVIDEARQAIAEAAAWVGRLTA